MVHLIDKSALVAEINQRIEDYKSYKIDNSYYDGLIFALEDLRDDFIDTLEVKEVDLIIHTIIAECCDWLAINTNLSHDKIEGCRNLMLTVKEERFKATKDK